MVGYYHTNILPWTRLPEDQGQLFRITQIVFAVFLIFGTLIPVIPVPERERYQSQDIPPRLAKLIVEKKAPKPVPKVEEPKLEEKPVEEVKVEEKKPEPKKEEVKKEEPTAEALAAKARAKAARSGLLALADELEDLREAPDVAQIDINMARRFQEGNIAAEAPSLLTMNTASSGGIDTRKLANASSRTRQLTARDTAQVESPVAKAADEGRSKPRQQLRGPRTLEQINLVMERYKGALTRLHSIALRKNPSIEGKVVLEMAIAAGGTVTECKVLSADFQDSNFLGRVEAKCRTFDFGPANDDMKVNYPVDFIPIS